MFKTLGRRGTVVMTNLAFEGTLVFAVLYLCAMVTETMLGGRSAQSTDTTEFSAVAMLGSLVFASTLIATPPRRLHGTLSVGRQLLVSLIVCLAVGVAAFVVCWALLESVRSLTGLIMLEGAIAVPLVVTAWRWTVIHLRVLQGNQERLLIVGTGEAARNLARWVTQHCPGEYSIVGFAAPARDEVGKIVASGSRVVADFDDLTGPISGGVERVIVALEEKRGVLPTEALMELRLRGLVIEDATSFLERTTGKIAVENLLPSWLIFSDGFRVSRVRLALKRVSDVVLSGILLAFAAPVMAATALAIRLESPGPVLYRQKRVGSGGREFEVYKFRSMVRDAENRSGPAWATADDPRVTRVGRFIRKTRIDELPQLFNVFRGEMSFVGPRPERRHFVEQLQKAIPYFNLRLSVRPGITGWAQVQYGYGSTLEENREKLKYDLFYIKNVGFFLDLWIVVKTIGVVLRGSGAR